MNTKKPKTRNPVAKHGRTFNKGGAHRDRSKYDEKERKQKWKEIQSGLMSTIEDPKEEDWDMLPDVEDLEKIVQRELKKLEEPLDE